MPTGSTPTNDSTVHPFEEPVSPLLDETEVKLYAQWAKVVELTGNSTNDNDALKNALESSDKTIIIQVGSADTADTIVIPSGSTLQLNGENKKLIINSGVTVKLQGGFEIVKYELENNGTFIADTGCTFTISGRFINQSVFTNNGQVTNEQTFVNNGTHTNNGKFINNRAYTNNGQYTGSGTFENEKNWGTVDGTNKGQITAIESTGG